MLDNKLKRVLVVEDSKATAALYKDMILGMEIAEEVHVCKSGNEALNYLQGKDNSPPVPELIFLDIMMDDMDGLTFMEKYSELDDRITNNFKPVIAVVSDYLDPQNFASCKDFKSYGLVGHIRKPMDQEDVEELIEEFF